jgi:hypothetical protein
VRLRVSRSHVLVQNSKNLRVQHLESSDAIHHAFQLLKFKHKITKFEHKWAGISSYDSFDEFVFAVHPLHPQDVVAEIESFETPLLAQQHENSASGPVQAFSEQFPGGKKQFLIKFEALCVKILLDGEFSASHRNAVYELQR